MIQDSPGGSSKNSPNASKPKEYALPSPTPFREGGDRAFTPVRPFTPSRTPAPYAPHTIMRSPGSRRFDSERKPPMASPAYK